MTNYVDIVFDGPPGPKAGRFVEVEDDTGKSIRFGEWMKRDDGFWALRLTGDMCMRTTIEHYRGWEIGREPEVTGKGRFMATRNNGMDKLFKPTLEGLKAHVDHVMAALGE